MGYFCRAGLVSLESLYKRIVTNLTQGEDKHHS
jgi:hypothetical protein